MDEIKIWELDGTRAAPVQPGAMLSEKQLEDTLVENPDLLMLGLKLVGRQTPTANGPLDLLGVDPDGKLVVFELKRDAPSRDAVAQVIDYASYLEAQTNDALSRLIGRNFGDDGIDDQLAEIDLDSLRPVHMVLVGLGADRTTERMVNFLANNGTPISLLTFQGFHHGGKTLLARVGQFRPLSRWDELVQRARSYGVYELFTQTIEILRENWKGSDEYVYSWKLGLDLRLRTVVESGNYALGRYTRVDPEDSLVRVVFYGPSVQSCQDKFKQAIVDIPFETWPRALKSDPFKEPDTEIQFLLSPKNWEIYEETLTDLALSVYDGLQEKSQDGSSSEWDPEGDPKDSAVSELTP